MTEIKQKVQVSIPFTMLHDIYLERVLENRLNPEIGIDAEALERFSRSDFTQIAAKLQQHSLRITLHGPFMDLAAGSPDVAVREITRRRLAQLSDLVPIFRPQTVVCHLGYDRRRYGYDPEGWYARSLELWRSLAQRLNEAGTRLMLENVFEDDPEDMLALFEPLQDLSVGFCLDPGHQQAFGRSPLERWYRVLAPYLGQVHLHDNLGDEDAHLALGRGRIDFNTLLAGLKALCPVQPVVTIEAHREEDLWPSLDYLEGIWPWG